MIEAAVLAACLIVGVTDGDTLTARCTDQQTQQYKEVRIRLAAVDAPESGQAYGSAARTQLSELCFQQPVTINFQSLDRYGRYIADVSCQDKDAGRFMVGAGYAWAYRRYLGGRNDLLVLERDARKHQLGLWRDIGTAAPPIEPELFRRGGR